MRIVLALCVVMAGSAAGLGQSVAGVPALPKEPEEIFAAAAPLYDFAGVKKPWHMKVSYQLYDEKDKPSEQGTYEYWWASADTYRSSWRRAGAEHTDWHVEGKHTAVSTGEPLAFFEWGLRADLLAPLPTKKFLDPQKVRFEREEKKLGTVKLPCVMAFPKMALNGHPEAVPLGMFPTYCFEKQQPLLRAYFAFGAMSVLYNKVVRMQGMFLPREVLVLEGQRLVLKATVDVIDGILPSAPELTPPPEISTVKGPDKIEVASAVSAGNLVKSVQPRYPPDAKDARIQGRVELKALIGRDGHIHELSVIDGPSPSLIASAMWAALQWTYKPYLLNGEPVDVDTTINVIFRLGN